MTDTTTPDESASTDSAPAIAISSIWSFYDLTTGLFSGAAFHGTKDECDQQLTYLGSGVGAYEAAVDHYSQSLNITTALLEDYQPPAPASDADQTWVWDTTVKRWVSTPTLLFLQGLKWTAMQAVRDTLEAGNFTFNSQVYQINRVNITGAAVDASFAISDGENTSWSQDWILADNTTTTLTATQMIALARAVKAYVDGLYTTSQALRTSIEATTEASQLDTITWPS